MTPSNEVKDMFAVTVRRTAAYVKVYTFRADDKDDAAEQALAVAETDTGPGWANESLARFTYGVAGIEHIPEPAKASTTFADLGVGDLDEAE